MEIKMDNALFGTRAGYQGNALKTSTVVDDTETAILLTHKRYFQGNTRNHDNEVLYDSVIKYFAGVSKIS
jgi:hypothetical protein